MKDKVIIIAGRKRAGKDTVANLFIKHLDKAVKVPLATPMKELVADMLHISMEDLEDLKNNEQNPHRGYLQRFGQKAKEYFGEDCWINYNRHLIANLPKGTTAIISDFRFPKESKEGDITINVINDRLPENLDSHSSENSMGNCMFDYTIYNNGTIREVEEEVVRVVNSLKADGKF